MDTGGPPCPAPTPACDAVNRTAADIRATFTKPCSPEDDRQCGGVVSSATLEAGQYVVETFPLVGTRGRLSEIVLDSLLRMLAGLPREDAVSHLNPSASMREGHRRSALSCPT
jgi:hypothetical protein